MAFKIGLESAVVVHIDQKKFGQAYHVSLMNVNFERIADQTVSGQSLINTSSYKNPHFPRDELQLYNNNTNMCVFTCGAIKTETKGKRIKSKLREDISDVESPKVSLQRVCISSKMALNNADFRPLRAF